MVESKNFILITFLMTTSSVDLSLATATALIPVKDAEPPKNWMMRLIQNQPTIYGFRAESQKHPVVIDENGFTVIPDKVFITLRLFGNNLLTGLKPDTKIRVGFTTTDGKGGERCDPETREFTAHEIVDNNMALVMVNLSENNKRQTLSALLRLWSISVR